MNQNITTLREYLQRRAEYLHTVEQTYQSKGEPGHTEEFTVIMTDGTELTVQIMEGAGEAVRDGEPLTSNGR